MDATFEEGVGADDGPAGVEEMESTMTLVYDDIVAGATGTVLTLERRHCKYIQSGD